MILVFAENKEGKFKKNAFEAVKFGSSLASDLGMECHAVVLGESDQPESLGKYGAKKVIHLNNHQLNEFDDVAYKNAINKVASDVGANFIILSHTALGKGLIGRLAVSLKAGCVPAVKGHLMLGSDPVFVKPVFSGKAFAHYQTSGPSVISIIPNSLQLTEVDGADPVEVEEHEVEVSGSGVKLIKKDVITGTVPLPEAELVVSAGRGMKDPSNWGIIEELANELGATTACSRPVSDSGWRPHHEHVGQTGIAIRPNLYIAIGISGAIQHLAGVNNSKVIVVINKDPEAPFFKAADYGICADLFEVVPKLTEAVKKYKAASN